MFQNRTHKFVQCAIIELEGGVNKMFKENFVNNIKQARKKAKMTQEKVAEKLNTSRSNITKYELGTLEPNIETIGMLAEIYNVSTDWLFGIIENNNINNQEQIENKYAKLPNDKKAKYNITQNNNTGNNFFNIKE